MVLSAVAALGITVSLSSYHRVTLLPTGRARSARRSALPASGHVATAGTDSAVAARGAGGEAFATRLRGGGTMMAPANNRRDRVRAMLADLKMPGALEVIDGILAQADSGATTSAARR